MVRICPFIQTNWFLPTGLIVPSNIHCCFFLPFHTSTFVTFPLPSSLLSSPTSSAMSPRATRGHAFLSQYHDPLNQDQIEKLHISHALPPVNPAIRQYFKKADHAEPTAEPDWRNKPEFPASDEILGTDTATDDVLLAPNKIFGPWSSTEEYLKTHYNLIREDAVAPLRDAVAFVREDPSIMDTKDAFIYEKVSR